MKKTILNFLTFSLFTIFLTFISCNQGNNVPVYSNPDPTTQTDNGDSSNAEKERLYNEVVSLINNKTFKESQNCGYEQNETVEWLNASNTLIVNNSSISVSTGSYTKDFTFALFDVKTITRETYGTKVYIVKMNNNIQLKIDPCYYTGIVYWDQTNNFFAYFTISTNTTTTTNPPTVQTTEINGIWYLNKDTSSQQNVTFNSGNISVTANTGSGNTRTATYSLNGSTMTITFVTGGQSLTGDYTVSLNNNQLTLSGTGNDYISIAAGLFLSAQSTNLVFVK